MLVDETCDTGAFSLETLCFIQTVLNMKPGQRFDLVGKSRKKVVSIHTPHHFCVFTKNAAFQISSQLDPPPSFTFV